MREQRFRLPPDARPPGTPPSLAARRLLFELQADGYVIELREEPARLVVQPGCPDRLGELQRCGYELRDLLREERAS